MALITKPVGAIVSDGPAWLKRYFITTNQILWADSVTGSDANSGFSETAPKATVFGASGAVAASDDNESSIVIVKKTHRETLPGGPGYSLTKDGCTVVGLGTGATSLDRAQFTVGNLNAAALAGDNIRLENVYFTRTGAAGGILNIFGARVELRDVLMDINAVVNIGIQMGGSGSMLKGVTLSVSALGGTGQIGVAMSTSGHIVESTTFNGGTTGFGGSAFDVNAAAADMWRFRECVLNNYSVGKVSISGAKGFIDAACDATSRVEFLE